MKSLAPALLLLLLAACITSTYATGRDFPAEKIGAIARGRTTAAELEQLFGPPYSKTVLSETEQQWVFTRSTTTTRARTWVFAVKSDAVVAQKTLSVRLKDGVVTGYTFTEAPGAAR